MKINKHIEIVRTNILSCSSMSHTSAIKIQEILSRHYTNVTVSVVNNLIDLELIVRSKPDLVFLGLKRLELVLKNNKLTEIWLANYLEKNQISYTGSRAAAVQFDFDKASAKEIVSSVGIPTANSFTTLPNDYTHANGLPLNFPLFIKPLSTGGGNGVDPQSVVRSFSEYEIKVSEIFEKFGAKSLVEEYLTGREFSVAILDDISGGEPMLMPIEIITEPNINGDRVLGSRVKIEDHELVIGVNNNHIKNEICKLALAAYRALGGRDLARIDIRMDKDGKANFLGANFVPGPGTRYFAGACQINLDIAYEAVLLKIVGLGLSRNQRLILPKVIAVKTPNITGTLETLKV